MRHSIDGTGEAYLDLTSARVSWLPPDHCDNAGQQLDQRTLQVRTPAILPHFRWGKDALGVVGRLVSSERGGGECGESDSAINWRCEPI